jgi:thiol-disulfide isomerase/thioredoxin
MDDVMCFGRRLTQCDYSKSAFDEALGEKETLMVLDCFATWCGPCKVIAPQVVK